MFKKIGSIILTILLVLNISKISEAKKEDLKKITIQLRWNHQYQFSGYYAADWKGFYEEEGLDVEIKPGNNSRGTTQIAPEEVYNGNAEFGIGSSDILLFNDKIKNPNKKLVVISSVFQKSPIRYYIREGAEYKNLADLAEMKVGIREGDLLSIEFKTMLLTEGIDWKKIPLIDKNDRFYLSDLDNKYDVIPGYTGGIIDYYAKKEGKNLKEVKAIDFGIDFYGDSIFTSKELIEKDPELVEKFRRASMKGWKYSIENPNEITKRIVKEFENSELNNKEEYLEYNKGQASRIKENTLYPVVELGNINPHRWDEMSRSLKKLSMIDEVENIDDYIFNYNELENKKTTESLDKLIKFTAGMFIVFLGIFLKNLHSKKCELEKEVVERKTAEKLLKKEKERYEILFNSFTIGIVLTKNSGEIIQVNKKWKQMIGYAENEIIGKPMKCFISSDNNDIPNKLINKLTIGEINEYEVEQKYIKKNGDFFWGNLFMVTMTYGKSEEIIYLNMVADITNKKMMEESLKRVEERFRRIIKEVASGINLSIDFTENIEGDKVKVLNKIERINLKLEELFKNELEENRKKEALIIHQARLAAMGEMIGNIAHQWRQPLNTFSITLANLEDAYKYNELDEDNFNEVMKKSKSLINQMSNTIDDFRYFFNPINKKEKFKPYESIKSIIYLLEENLRFDNIKVNFSKKNFEEKAYGYRNQYAQALFNIISNSIDALGDSSTKDRKIEISLQKTDNEFICIIKDNAGGVGEDIIDNIFDMYFTTKESKKGTGLGLYISKTIIENNLKGKIKCINTDKGLQTKIIIPREEKQNDK